MGVLLLAGMFYYLELAEFRHRCSVQPLFVSITFETDVFVDSTLLKGLAVLERLIHADSPLGVSALASEFELPKSNMHRTLTTLAEAGYVSQNTTGNYLPTLKTWELGVPIMSRHPVRRAAIVFMHHLQNESQETVNLVVLDGDDSLYIHQISSSMPIRASSTVGERTPAIMTVSGQAMLAFQPNATKRIRELYAKQKSPKPAKKLSEILKESEQIHQRGYAMAESVWRPGVNSLAAVIFGPDKQAIGAIAITGPKERFTEKNMKANIPQLLNTCTNVSRALGA